jgi:hypothetical protein
MKLESTVHSRFWDKSWERRWFPETSPGAVTVWSARYLCVTTFEQLHLHQLQNNNLNWLRLIERGIFSKSYRAHSFCSVHRHWGSIKGKNHDGELWNQLKIKSNSFRTISHSKKFIVDWKFIDFSGSESRNSVTMGVEYHSNSKHPKPDGLSLGVTSTLMNFYHVRASWSWIERSSNIVSLFKELENIRIDAWFLSRKGGLKLKYRRGA